MTSRWTALGPVLLYLAFAALLIAQRPGLQYEEAAFQHGAVHLLTDPHGPPRGFVSDPAGWIAVGGIYWPLMIVGYVGALPYYVFAVPFALFGSDPVVARTITALLGALGIAGLCHLLRKGPGAGVALATGLALIHPSYVVHTVFNKASLAFWMGSLGALAFCVASYLDRRTRWRAFAVGLAAGLGCWAWLQFGVLLVAAAIAVLLVLGRRAFVPRAHLALAAAGGVTGLAPWLLYQLHSAGSTLRSVGYFAIDEAWGGRFATRLGVYGETLVCDAEQRLSMWAGPPVPRVQAWVMVGVLVAGLAAACFTLRGGLLLTWHRILALCTLQMSALLVLAPLPFTPHYFIAVMPVAMATIVLAAARLAEAHAALKMPLLALGAALAASLLVWDVRIYRALSRSGGRGDWSDAIGTVASHLQTLPEGRAVTVLDWGLANNLYVLSWGRIQPQEAFWDATPKRASNGVRWEKLVAQGGFFLTTADEQRHFPAATAGFERALQGSGQPFRRLDFHGRDGHPFSELYVVEPEAPAAK